MPEPGQADGSKRGASVPAAVIAGVVVAALVGSIVAAPIDLLTGFTGQSSGVSGLQLVLVLGTIWVGIRAGRHVRRNGFPWVSNQPGESESARHSLFADLGLPPPPKGSWKRSVLLIGADVALLGAVALVWWLTGSVLVGVLTFCGIMLALMIYAVIEAFGEVRHDDLGPRGATRGTDPRPT